MRGLLIGYGFIAEAHLLGYRSIDGLDIVAAVDISSLRREAAARAGLVAFATIEEALTALDFDFVDVCTPPSLHLAGLRMALDRGLPVLCEKPVFVPDETEIDDVVNLANRGPGLVYPCQNYKFAPIFSRTRQLLETGVIGEVRFARIDIARAGHARGVPEWRPDWRRESVYSTGGILRDHGPHAVYLLQGMVLKDLPLEVSAVALPRETATGASATPTTEDTVLMRICAQDAVRCDVNLTWASAYRNSRYLFVGARGFISIDNDLLTWSAGDEIVTESVRSDFDDPSHSAWFADMLADFEHVVRSGPAGRARAFHMLLESLRTTAVIEAGYESASHHGTWIPVPKAAFLDGGIEFDVVSDSPNAGVGRS